LARLGCRIIDREGDDGEKGKNQKEVREEEGGSGAKEEKGQDGRKEAN
jgi:hypothetical protein